VRDHPSPHEDAHHDHQDSHARRAAAHWKIVPGFARSLAVAAGLKGILQAQFTLEADGPVRGLRPWSEGEPERIGAFDCQSCSWRARITGAPVRVFRELREGLASEGTPNTPTRNFSYTHAIGRSLRKVTNGLEKAGRLTHPWVKARGPADGPTSDEWDELFPDLATN